ncbi:amino acid racemase, partial [Endobacter medicaginis]
AGADCVLICTNTMHLVASDVAAATDLPLIDIIDATGAALLAAGRTNPLLLATAYTMQHGFYQQRMREGSALEVSVPPEAQRAQMHGIIFDELCRGTVRDSSRACVQAMVAEAAAAGADSVILGCTEICMLVDGTALALPCFDSTRIHAEAAVAFALSGMDLADRAA